MDKPFENVPSDVTALDDWQRGFIDSIFYSQQITNPTPAQYSAALKRMNGFLLSRHGANQPADGRLTFGVEAHQ